MDLDLKQTLKLDLPVSSASVRRFFRLSLCLASLCTPKSWIGGPAVICETVTNCRDSVNFGKFLIIWAEDKIIQHITGMEMVHWLIIICWCCLSSCTFLIGSITKLSPTVQCEVKKANAEKKLCCGDIVYKKGSFKDVDVSAQCREQRRNGQLVCHRWRWSWRFTSTPLVPCGDHRDAAYCQFLASRVRHWKFGQSNSVLYLIFHH